MAVLWLRALRSFDDLDAKSKLRFGAHLGRFLRFADSLYLNFLDGTLDKRLWRGYVGTNGPNLPFPPLPPLVAPPPQTRPSDSFSPVISPTLTPTTETNSGIQHLHR